MLNKLPDVVVPIDDTPLDEMVFFTCCVLEPADVSEPYSNFISEVAGWPFFSVVTLYSTQVDFDMSNGLTGVGCAVTWACSAVWPAMGREVGTGVIVMILPPTLCSGWVGKQIQPPMAMAKMMNK